MNPLMKLPTFSTRLAYPLVLLLAFLLAFVTPRAAANEEASSQNANSGRTFGNGILSTYAAFYDADNNGTLSHEEQLLLERDRRSRQTNPEQVWDTNRDGVVSDAESAAARRSIEVRIERHRSLRFDGVDSDRDGHLSEDEFLAINAVIAINSDTPGIGRRIFRSLDRDQDQRISRDEFLRRLASTDPSPTESPPKSHPRQNISN